MVRSYFEIPDFFIVENSKQRINVNIVTNVSFGNLVVILVSSSNLPKIVRVTCDSKDVTKRIC